MIRNAGRISGSSVGAFSNNFGVGSPPTDTDNPGHHGTLVTLATIEAGSSWWTGTLGWTIHSSKAVAETAIMADPDASPWVWDATRNRPVMWFEMP